MADVTLTRLGRARRWRLGRIAASDPGFVAALLLVSLFVAVAVLYPLFQILSQGFFTRRGELDLSVYQSIISRPVYQTIIQNTLTLGTTTAILGTTTGFLLAYTLLWAESPLPQ